MLNRNLLNCFLICLWTGALLIFCQNASAATDYSAQELKQLIDSGKPIFLLNPLNTSQALPKYNVPGIKSDEFKKLLGTACYVDIRTPKLYGLGNIKAKFGPNADKLSLDYKKKYFLKIPLYKLSSQYNKIPKDRRVVVFDYRGKQSLIASRFLRHKGYEDVCLLKGGIEAVKGPADQ